jgi:hypothetical protein
MNDYFMNTWLINHSMIKGPRVISVRNKIEKYTLTDTKQEVPLSILAFTSRSRVGGYCESLIVKNEQEWLEDPIGAIILSEGSTRSDPLLCVYLVVKISPGTFMEGFITHEDDDICTFYINGLYFGSLVEITDELVKPISLWQRLFRMKRYWKVFIGEQCYGEIMLQYPLYTKDQIYLCMRNGIELPISHCNHSNITSGGGKHDVPFQGLSSRLMGSKKPRVTHGDMIIPLNTPRYNDSAYTANIERMHFLINIIYRTYIFKRHFDKMYV